MVKTQAKMFQDNGDTIELKRQIDVLLVEDNTGDVVLFKHMLSHSDHDYYNVTDVPKLVDAFTILDETSFDAVVLDLGLLDMDGLAAVAALHNKIPGTPIIIHSGNTDLSLEHKAFLCGASSYLIKGQVDSETVQRTIKHAIDNKLKTIL